MATYIFIDELIMQDPTTIATNAAGPDYQLGLAVRVYVVAYKTTWFLKYVQNKDATAQAAGYPVCYQFATYSNDYQVDQPATATLDRLAGICLGAIGIDGYGFIVERGITTANALGSTDTTGQNDGTASIPVGASLQPVNVKSYLCESKAAGTEATYARRAYATTKLTSGVSTLLTVFVDCL